MVGIICRLYSFQTNRYLALCSATLLMMMSNLGSVLLRLTGAENLAAKYESRIHTTSGLS
jgi:hypothetical protein